MDRRAFTGSLAAAAAAAFFRPGTAKALVSDSGEAMPPMDSAEKFIAWAAACRGEDPKFLVARFDRFRRMVGSGDLTDPRNKRAFLLTPRESFVLKQNLGRAYAHAFLDIGGGVTMSGPHVVARMTQALDVKPGDKVLEIGTGSGYHSAYLANLTNKVWTVEVVKPLAERTARLRDHLIETGYSEYEAIAWKHADGYCGWEQAAPFDKILVACGIDHVPPPLLAQLQDDGMMVVPVGPPGAQRILRILKRAGADGRIKVARSDVYDGRIVPFMPFIERTDPPRREAAL